MPPSHNSLSCEVVAVVPVLAALLVPVAEEIWSNGPTASKPRYSATTAAARSEAAMEIATWVPAPETLDAIQISVVVPLPLVAWVTRAQVVPDWVMPETRLAEVPRVEITAIRVLPATGLVVRFTLKPVTEAAPEVPVALWTRTGVT